MHAPCIGRSSVRFSARSNKKKRGLTLPSEVLQTSVLKQQQHVATWRHAEHSNLKIMAEDVVMS